MVAVELWWLSYLTALCGTSVASKQTQIFLKYSVNAKLIKLTPLCYNICSKVTLDSWCWDNISANLALALLLTSKQHLKTHLSVVFSGAFIKFDVVDATSFILISQMFRCIYRFFCLSPVWSYYRQMLSKMSQQLQVRSPCCCYSHLWPLTPDV